MYLLDLNDNAVHVCWVRNWKHVQDCMSLPIRPSTFYCLPPTSCVMNVTGPPSPRSCRLPHILSTRWPPHSPASSRWSVWSTHLGANRLASFAPASRV